MTDRKAAQFSAVNKGAARYALLLDCLADRYPDMVSLAEIARLTNLPKPTAFRLMKALQEVGFAAYDGEREAYLFGAKMMELGAKALTQNFTVIARPSLIRLAEETQDTAFAGLAENNHMHCVLRVLGSYPVRSLSLEEGDVWPLGVGGVGLALLAAHDEAFVARYIENYLPVITRYSQTTAQSLHDRVGRTRADGFASSERDVLAGVSALGVAIVHPLTGRPFGAISIAAISSRMEAERSREIVGLLRREARLITDTLAGQSARAEG